MCMSLVAMNVWMRGRSLSRTAFQAASMSCLDVRARPQITGPWTSRAIACTDSKSPGEVMGKPASMMSTPRRASWWAISSFSCRLSEIPGDCSPSRSVVSKIRTRSASLRWVVLMSCSLSVSPVLLRAGLRLRGRHALFPPKGEEKELRRREQQRHLRRSGLLEGEIARDDRFDRAVVEQLAQGLDPRRERVAVLPQREHVQPDHG